jgi:hypothetical protein
MCIGYLLTVPYYQKPVHAERLIGYLDSMQTRVLKRQEGVALALAPKKAQ